MKVFVQIATVVLAAFILINVSSCSEESSTGHSTGAVIFSEYQVPGCNNSGLDKTLYNDTCFVYRFDEKLSIDCCVNANCCPDSNRFDILQQIYGDTIVVTVADTAAHLCKCMCNYIVRLEWENLPKNAYTFICYAEDGLKYSESVHQ